MQEPQEKRSHWDDDPAYPVEDWRAEVANDDTRLGYTAWVGHQKETREAESQADSVPRSEFSVRITETSSTKVEMYFDGPAFPPSVTNAKNAFRVALDLFYAPENRVAREMAEDIISCDYTGEVEDGEGNIFLFDEGDDDGSEFIPENHLQE